MVDAAAAWAEHGGRCWFIAPTVTEQPEPSSRPSVVELLRATAASERLSLVTWPTGPEFQFGTARYRTLAYVRAIEQHVPPGVPVILSDDAAVWRAAAMLGARNPMVGVLHSDEATYYALANRYQNELAALVCVSRRIAERVGDHVGRRTLPVATIPCGVPLSSGRAGPVEDTRRVVWVGRMEESSKRVSDLPKIARALASERADVRIDVIGDGPERARLREGFVQNDLSALVVFHGWLERDAVIDVLNRCDVLLLPSNFEGMSVSIMEALAAGCAIVSTVTSGIEDYARHELAADCVWTYPVGDVARAAACVAAALAVPRDVRRPRARAFAAAEFSIARCVSAYGSFLATVRPPTRPTPALLRGLRVMEARLDRWLSSHVARWRLRRLARSAA